jgi:LytS/YehU family sensor histidine kinase
VLSVYVDLEFGRQKFQEWLVVGILWVVDYFFFALAYYYFTSSIHKQKLLAKMMQEQLHREKERLELENALLKAQVNPHFIYNSLNCIYSKSLPVSRELSDAIMKLSEIMRYSLEEQDGDGFVLLSSEVAHIRNIIEMARLRFNNRIFLDLSVSKEIDGIKVLPLALVTLVENVLKHGTLNDQTNPARISIEKLGQEQLQFSTWNRKRIGPKESSTNIGLRNTVRRLEEVYGNRCTIAIDDRNDSFQTSIKLPLSPVL